MQFYAIVKETFIFCLKNKNKSKHEFVVELLHRNIINEKSVCYTYCTYFQHVQYIAKKRKYGTIQGIIIQVGYREQLIVHRFLVNSIGSYRLNI